MATPLTLTVTGFPAGNCAWTEQVMALTPLDCTCARRGAAVRPSLAHDLVAAPAEIPDRRAPDVHEAREREDQEDRHAEEQVQP